MTPRRSSKPLAGWRVLVPRGGEWGNNVAAALRKYGAAPVVAPMVNFAATHNQEELAAAFTRLEAGEFEWLVITSSATVNVLTGHGVNIPDATRIAAVGELTAAAVSLAGYRIDFTPEGDTSSRGLVKEWAAAPPAGAILVLQSESADESLSTGLAAIGATAEIGTAYCTIGVDVPSEVVSEVAAGHISGILITSVSVVGEIQRQLAPLPEGMTVVAIGPRTAFEAREAGIAVNVIAEYRTAESLVDALVELALR